VLSLQDEKGREVAQAQQAFSLPALGDQSLEIPLTIPRISGKCVLKATARPSGKLESTISRRWVSVEANAS
jgi:hypothetical protein